MASDSSKIWTAFSLVSALVAATAVRKGLNTSWKAATGKNPPENPADPDVDVREAVAWTVAGLAMALLVAGLLSYGSARLEVADGAFRAGRARIDAGFLGSAEALDADATRRVAGPQADARAFLLLRPYLKRAVRVAITDPADPAPYWLVSSRRPDRLAEALNGLTEVRG